MSPWGWTPARNLGIWRHGAMWYKPFTMIAPWFTIIVLLIEIWLISQTMTSARGVLFELPECVPMGDADGAPLVALVIPMGRDTLIFFDDARYSLDDVASADAFAVHLAERVEKIDQRTLLVLADRRVAAGSLSNIAALARASGVSKLMLASKNSQEHSQDN